jgi:hypothetical protein
MKVRIQSGLTDMAPYDTIITDADGNKLPFEVSSAIIRLRGGEMPIATLGILNPEFELVAEMVDLDRLLAAEAVCRQVQRLLTPQPPGSSSLWRGGVEQKLRQVLAEWEAKVHES